MKLTQTLNGNSAPLVLTKERQRGRKYKNILHKKLALSHFKILYFFNKMGWKALISGNFVASRKATLNGRLASLAGLSSVKS